MRLARLLILTASLAASSAASTPARSAAFCLPQKPEGLNHSHQKTRGEVRGRAFSCTLSERSSRMQRPFLAAKPSYPPAKPRAVYKPTPSSADCYISSYSPSFAADIAELPGLTPECSCEDVHEQQRKLEAVANEQRVLRRNVSRLESALSEVLETLRTADDLALLERQAAGLMVFNENLTTRRKLRLIRTEIALISAKYAL